MEHNAVMHEKDEVIYKRFLEEGNSDDMKELMRRHRESLTLFLYGIVHNMEDAEELMLDAFVVAGMGRSRFRGSSSFKSWLFAIGRNQAISLIRKQRRSVLPLNENLIEENTPEMELLRKEQNRQLYSAINALNPDYRQTLYLIYFEEMSTEEVGRVMKKSRKQIYNLVQRSKGALRRELEKID